MFNAARKQVLHASSCCSPSTASSSLPAVNFATRRSLSSTITSRAPITPEAAEPSISGTGNADDAATTDSVEVQDVPVSSSSSSKSSTGRGYAAWLNGDGAGYRNPIKGRTNWLGETPFPLNPTFRPLPPLADTVKTKIYNAYTYNILAKDATDSQVVRAVAAKFGIAMDRVRAVIRLKELEKSWKDQGITLQTNLLENMESYLGVKQPVSSENWRGQEALSEKPAYASTKTLFEMVDEESGDVPVFLPLLADLPDRKLGDKPSTSSSSSAAPASAAAPASERSSSSAQATVIPASRPGRAATVFLDVGSTDQGDAWRKTYDPKRTKRGKKKAKSTSESTP